MAAGHAWSRGVHRLIEVGIALSRVTGIIVWWWISALAGTRLYIAIDVTWVRVAHAVLSWWKVARTYLWRVFDNIRVVSASATVAFGL